MFDITLAAIPWVPESFFLLCFAATVSGEAAIVNERKKNPEGFFFARSFTNAASAHCRHKTKQKQKDPLAPRVWPPELSMETLPCGEAWRPEIDENVWNSLLLEKAISSAS